MRRELRRVARSAAFIYSEADPQRSFEYSLNPHAQAIAIINVLDPHGKYEDLQFAKHVLLEVGRAKAIMKLQSELQLILAASRKAKEILQHYIGEEEVDA